MTKKKKNKLNPFTGQVDSDKKQVDPNSEYQHPSMKHFEQVKAKGIEEQIEKGTVNIRELNEMDHSSSGHKYTSKDYFNFHRKSNIPFRKRVIHNG